ncbi:ScbR family autoregulator-binding transcription factor [Streptomyces sp. NPDC046203]|uniref:ScbR family autoregulator-binding transcription factor n=1 Tax=Streptomyces sp. NPDC046203 TaxID=3154602 RepID=UPI0033E9D39B
MARQERAVRTRRKILLAAAGLFDEVGYEAATIAEVLRRCGVTKGALYFHFSSKEELAQEVLAWQAALFPPVPPRPLLLQTLIDEALVLAHLLGTGDPLTCGSVRLVVDQGSPHDGLDRRAPMRAWIDRIADLFTRARTAGELLPHVDVSATAHLLAASFTGVQVFSKVMTGHADMVERVSDLLRTTMGSVAVPGVLVRLDFSPSRARPAHEEALWAVGVWPISPDIPA